ncbi:beta-1,4-N-acetylgalactosaminyltransferase bre-4 [Galendromus occidentalis]|uniref:Beta-1,4-N-acetylgalactosaminyltransferase n=1 Tax=Galendromus occidentalis TaxID=34638 RepID=A0AAJ6QQZ1_9ACAR|nr:beta-1,4-N-acetylgalactosaminyltransferase bre-4 [Galendromus occidentalis]
MRSSKCQSLRMLSCEQWMMALAVSLFLLALRCPTGRFVVFSSPEEDLVSCASLVGRCPLSSALPGSMLIKRVLDESVLTQLERELHGHYNQSGFPLIRASGCESAFRTAIIVPFRNRSEHLDVFLRHMHSFLPQQNIDYSIYVVEQSERHKFNRGKLMNIGFKEALRDMDYCCFIFHDVDLLPENPRNLYACSKHPRHMCVAIDTFRYVVPYADIFGGVVAMQKDHFVKVNGFSNRFFGWGAEDDDLALRIQSAKLHITRWSTDISRYTALVHEKANPNPKRFDLLADSSSRWQSDGLIDLKYKLLSHQRTPLYTKITVDVSPDD